MTPLAKLLEAALFASGRPLPATELAALDPSASAEELTQALDEMRERYDTEGHGIELVELGGGWQILTRPEYTETIERAQLATRPARLSAAALETLAIVAYRQPIGRAEGLGRPLLYGTTPVFLEQFALRHLGELPRADELAVALRAQPQTL